MAQVTTDTTIDTLNSLLRGEISAIETYQQALDKLDNKKGTEEIRRLHGEHIDAANTLRRHIHQHGGQPDHGSGAWGAFAKAVEGTANVFGSHAALKALKEGEELGIKAYEQGLQDKSLPADCGTLIASTLLPRAREHLPVLDRLMAGLVERISPQQARRLLNADSSSMLVCAYDSQEKFEQHHLEGAIPLATLAAQVGSIPKDRAIVFYCA